MQISLTDLAKVVEVHMEPNDRFDDPSLFPEFLKITKQEAGQHPRSDNTIVSITLCGVDIKVSSKTSVQSMERDFKRAIQGFIIPQIGPKPKNHLSRQDFANDLIITEANTMLEGIPPLMIRRTASKSWQESLSDPTNTPFLRAVMQTSDRIGRILQYWINSVGVGDSSKTGNFIRSVKKAGIPTLDLDEGCELLRGVITRLSEEWHYSSLLDELADDMVYRPHLIGDIVRQVQFGKNTSLPEYTS